MKYARSVVVGNQTRLIDVVQIPDPIPNGLGTPENWLAKQFPTLGGFFLVDDSNEPGHVRNEDGTYSKYVPPAD